jgi:hypothetical protein
LSGVVAAWNGFASHTIGLLHQRDTVLTMRASRRNRADSSGGVGQI